MQYEERKATVDGFEIPIECFNRIHVMGDGELQVLHYHDYVEILYGVDCDITVRCGINEYQLKTGDFLVINSKTPHSVVSNKKISIYTVIKFVPQILYAAEQSVFEFKYIIPFVAETNKHRKFFKKSEIENTDISEIMRSIIEETQNHEYGHEIALRIYVSRIVLWLIREWHVSGEEDDISIDKIRSVQKGIEYAQNNYSTATSSKAAQICNLCPSYFSRLFKSVMKKSFTEYVTYIKICEAQKLLITTKASITDISLDTGFSTTSYFIDCFKKQTQLTPKQFRIKFGGFENQKKAD